MNLVVFLLLALVCVHAGSVREMKLKQLENMGLVKSSRNAEAASTCPAFTCAEDGQACGQTATSNVECGINSYCNIGKCTALTKVGGACATSRTCVDTAECIGSVCTTVVFTAAAGKPCAGATGCTSGLYCSAAGTCATLPSTAGAACDFRIGCGGALDCSVDTSTCVAMFTVPLGGNCTYTEDCTATNWCNDAGVCSTVPASSKTPCSSSADCPSVDEQCVCNVGPASPAVCVGPSAYTAQEATDVTTFLNCQQTSDCTALICPECTTNACTFFKSNYFQFPSDLACYTSDTILYHLCIGPGNKNSPAAALATPLLLVAIASVFAALW